MNDIGWRILSSLLLFPAMLIVSIVGTVAILRVIWRRDDKGITQE